MGCAGSTASGSPTSDLGGPAGKKQAQKSDTEKDEAAAAIQAAAANYNAKRKEQQQDAAAAEIQLQAAAFLKQRQSQQEAAAAEATKKPKLTLPPAPLEVAATAAVDAITQLSHRLFGGAEAPAAAPAPRRRWARPSELT